MDNEIYRISAIKYAQHVRRAPENFIGGDIHDTPMPMDYFELAITSATRSFIVDTGLDEAMASKRGRQITHSVAEGLTKIGLDPATM